MSFYDSGTDQVYDIITHSNLKIQSQSRLLKLYFKQMQTAAASNSDPAETVPKPQVIYRCKKCRRIVASEETIVPHERGKGEECFKWKKRSDAEREPPECSSIFVESMKWMQSVQEGFVEEKLQCIGCKARLGSFNWAGLQCNCGAWVTPAFQLHKSRLDECRI
ncbi:hypothetical protein ACOSQ2_012169 [Xanthoceras sorbifolium]